MEPLAPGNPRRIRVLRRGIIDEDDGRWFPVSLDTYFIEDLEVIRNVMPRITRVLVRRGSSATVDEIAVDGAQQRLLGAVPGPRHAGGLGVRLYGMGGAEIIAVLEELPKAPDIPGEDRV